jgi:hypothetical protein
MGCLRAPCARKQPIFDRNSKKEKWALKRPNSRESVFRLAPPKEISFLRFGVIHVFPASIPDRWMRPQNHQGGIRAISACKNAEIDLTEIRIGKEQYQASKGGQKSG